MYAYQEKEKYCIIITRAQKHTTPKWVTLMVQLTRQASQASQCLQKS